MERPPTPEAWKIQGSIPCRCKPSQARLTPTVVVPYMVTPATGRPDATNGRCDLTIALMALAALSKTIDNKGFSPAMSTTDGIMTMSEMSMCQRVLPEARVETRSLGRP